MPQRVLLPRHAISQNAKTTLSSNTEEKREISPTSTSTTRKRGPLVTAACTTCRKKKIKCDGKKPYCNNCYKRNIKCTYDETSRAERLRLLQERVKSAFDEMNRIKQEMNRIKQDIFTITTNITSNGTRELFAQAEEDLDHLKCVFEQIETEITTRPLEPVAQFTAGEPPIEHGNETDSSPTAPWLAPTFQTDSSGNERISVVILTASDTASSSGSVNIDPQLATDGILHVYQEDSGSNIYASAHHLLPLTTSIYDEPSKSCILHHLRCRQFLAQGLAPLDVLGPDLLDLTCLILPDSLQPVHEFTAWILSYFNSLPGSENANWAFKVASIYCIFNVFRWLIHPTLANYKRIPDFMRPTPVQLFVPHPFWINFVVSPEMRNEFVLRPDGDHYRQWSWLSVNSSINWPSTDISSMVVLHPDTNSFHLTTEFELAVNRIESWQIQY